MAAKLLLCVSADQATVAVWRSGRLSSCNSFGNNEEGWTAFSNFLRAAKGLPIHLMVDTVDEDFRFETLPHARGRDRAEMVARKLKQLYRGTPYFSSTLEERGTGKRGDDRYLFAALTDPEVLTPWLRAIAFNGVPVAGAYLLPVVTVALAERLKLKHPNLLILTKNSAGLRQTFFKQTKFRISRLTPLRGATEIADQYYADEVGNTRMYLDALTVTHVDDMLQVVILDQDGSLSGLPTAIARGHPNIQCQYLSQAEVQTRLGIPAAELATSADALHLHLLGTHQPALNLAPSTITGGYRSYLTRRWVYAASAAMLAGALLWSGANAYEVMRLDEETANRHRQAQQYQAQYQQVTAHFPQAPVSSEQLRQIVEMAQQVKASLRSPESMFLVVSRALDASPQVQLSSLEWHYGSAPVGQEAQGNTASGTRPPPDTTALVQSGIVRGDVRPFSGDYKAALTIINGFATQLASDGRVAEVKMLRLPLNVSSETGLSGSTTVASDRSSAKFELAIVFKAGT